jgi:hypothetical protein
MERITRLLVVLLASSTVLFAVGIGLERAAGDTQGVEERSEEPHTDEAEEVAEVGERVAGLDLESTPVVALAVAVGLVLTAAVLTRAGRDRRVLPAIAIEMLAWALLDLREVAHQLDESHTGVAAVAGVVAALHLAAAAVSVWPARAGAAERRARTRPSREPRRGSG